jgi:hypothetical protein
MASFWGFVLGLPSTGHDYFVQVWFLNILIHTKFSVKPSSGSCFIEGSVFSISTLYAKRPKFTGGLTSLTNARAGVRACVCVCVCVCLGTHVPADVGLLLAEIFSLDRKVPLAADMCLNLFVVVYNELESVQQSGVQFEIYYCVKRTHMLHRK